MLADFILQTIYWCVLFAGVVFFPGWILCRVCFPEATIFEKVVASAVTGIALFTLVQYVLGFAGLLDWFWLVALVLVCVCLLISYQLKLSVYKILKDFMELVQNHRLFIGLALLAALLEGSLHVFSGWVTEKGMVYQAFHGTDAPLHISCIDQLVWRFPPHKPGFHGAVWHNYHFLSDLFLSGFKRFAFDISTHHLYFRIAPLLYSLLISASMYVLVLRWSGSRKTALLSVGLTHFTAGWGYLLPLLTGQSYVIWESIFWLSPPFTNFYNPGVVTGFFLMLTGMWAMLSYNKKPDWKKAVVIAAVWGAAIGFKVFAGLIILAGLLGTALWQWWRQKKLRLLLLFAAVLVVAFAVFLPVNSGSGGLISFLPGYVLATMVASPDRMNVMHFDTLKSLYLENPILLAGLFGLLFIVFVVGNIGIKSIGFLSLPKTIKHWKKLEAKEVYLWLIVTAAFTAPMVLGQFGINWQSIQFGYYGVLLMAIPAGVQLTRWLESRPIRTRMVIVGLVFIAGLPCIVQSLIQLRWNHVVSDEEYQGYLYLQEHGERDDVVLRPLIPALRDKGNWNKLQAVIDHGEMTSIGDLKKKAEIDMKDGVKTKTERFVPERPQDQLLRETDSAFVAALSKRNTYLEDITTAQSMGFSYEGRLQVVAQLLMEEDADKVTTLLRSKKINYLLLYKNDYLLVAPNQLAMDLVFKNDEIRIYKINQEKQGENIPR